MPYCVCCECATQYAESAAPPPLCAICANERQYVGSAGQAWTTLDEVRKFHNMCIEQEDDRVIGIGMAPHRV